MNDNFYYKLAYEYRKLGVTPNDLRKTIKECERKLSWLKFKFSFRPGPCRFKTIMGLEETIERDKKVLEIMEDER